MFILFTYNNVPFTKFIQANFFIFAISAFTFLTVLMMVHVALDFVRKPPQSYICYLFFTLSECWVVGWLLASTDEATVFLFIGNLTANILAISIFLHSSTVTWFRGVVSLFVMASIVFVLAICTLNFADMITIVVCMIGGLLFGVFLLNKAFTLINNRYGH